MADYRVLDKNGTTWDYCTSKNAAETSRKALDKRRTKWKPFRAEAVKEEK